MREERDEHVPWKEDCAAAVRRVSLKLLRGLYELGLIDSQD